MTLTAEGVPGDSHWVLRQRSVDSDSVLRQLLGKDISDTVCTKEKLSLQFQEGTREGASAGNPPVGPLRRMGLVERRELKLARLKQIMQRSLSESDSDAYPPEEGAKHGGAPPPATGARLERPNHLPIAEGEEPITGLKKHGGSSTMERKSAFTHSSSKSMDGGVNPSPTSDKSDPDADGRPEASGDVQDYNNGQKMTTSPKSALKSPSSRRKTAQNLKLRVTFDEQVVHKNTPPPPEAEGKGAHGKEGGGRTSGGGEGGTGKRPFGAFRSIMESLSGNQNNNNNNAPNSPSVKHSNSQSSPGRRTTDSKSSPGSGGLSKGKNKTSNV